MKTAVVLGGRGFSAPESWQLLREAEYCIAADSGAMYCLNAGRNPDVLIGDMDSLDKTIVKQLAESGTEVIAFATAKDETDGELALYEAVRRGAEAVDVFAADGDRPDHMLANFFMALPLCRQGIQVRFIADEWIGYVSCAHIVLEDKRLPRTEISLLPLSPAVHDVCTEGLAYPLHGETLFIDCPRGISNIALKTRIAVSHSDGFLLLLWRYSSIGKSIKDNVIGGSKGV